MPRLFGAPDADTAAATASALSSYVPGPGANLVTACTCTANPQAQQAFTRIAQTTVDPATTSVSTETGTTTPYQGPADSPDQTPADAALTTADTTLPADWSPWQAPTEVSPDSFTDGNYSTEWETTQPDWVTNQEPLVSVAPQSQSITDLVGDEHAGDIYWENQGQTEFCGPYSIRSIISEMTGQQVDVNQVINDAEQRWGLDPSRGMSPDNIHGVFADFGVPTHEYQGANEQNAWEFLNSALQNNERAVVFVNGSELRAAVEPQYAREGLADHFVAVEHVDYARGVVIVNDSAYNRAGLEVPINVFLHAWSDGNFNMTVTDQPVPGHATTGGSAGGFAILHAGVTARVAAA
jgi:hypothetical protein